jgi:hypothetical protein
MECLLRRQPLTDHWKYRPYLLRAMQRGFMHVFKSSSSSARLIERVIRNQCGLRLLTYPWGNRPVYPPTP